MKNTYKLLLIGLIVFIAACGKSANEKEYDRITEVLKANEKTYKALYESNTEMPDSIRAFSDDLLILDYNEFLVRYHIDNEKEFLETIEITAQLLEQMNKVQ